MKSDLTLDEMLKSVFSLIVDDAGVKPRRSGKPVADPALWRALENQRTGSDGQSGNRSHIPLAAHPSDRN